MDDERVLRRVADLVFECGVAAGLDMVNGWFSPAVEDGAVSLGGGWRIILEHGDSFCLCMEQTQVVSMARSDPKRAVTYLVIQAVQSRALAWCYRRDEERKSEGKA